MDAKQWALPWGWEMNNLAYNRAMLDKLGVKPPRNMPEPTEAADRNAGVPAIWAGRIAGRRTW